MKMNINMAQSMASLLALCLSSASYAGTIPESIHCRTAYDSFGKGFQIQKLDSKQARVFISDEYSVMELAKKIGLVTAADSTNFYAIEFLINDGKDCQSNSVQPELVHCHGQAEVVFKSIDPAKAETPVTVTDISFSTSKVTTENPVTKFVEMQVTVGLILPDDSYSGTHMRLFGASCAQ